MQRRATIAVALSIGLSAEVAAQARGVMQQPGPDTPRLLVAVFESPDRVTGVQMADAVRSRVTSAVSVRQLYVVPKEQMVSFLESSGYRADSSLGQADLKELAKQLRADEILLGVVKRDGNVVTVTGRLALASDPRIAQPLAPITVNSTGDAARQIERALQDARKQIPDTKNCQNFIRSSEYPKAIAAANAALVKFPAGMMARVCLANAFVEMKASPDSVLRVTNEVIAADPINFQAYNFAYAAYSTKGDAENAIKMLQAMQKLDPTNTGLNTSIVTELAKLGQPTRALPIIDTLLIQNPGDPTLLKMRWQTTALAAANTPPADSAARKRWFGEVVTAGESMARGDTALADSTYYDRQIFAALGSDNNAKAVEFASRATQKFARSAYFWSTRANVERRAGQLDQAQQSMKQAVAIDPRTPNANVFIATIFIDQRRPDSAVAVAQRAIAAGEDRRTWGTFLLAPTNAAVTEAQRPQNADSVQYWERALALAQEAHRLSPQTTSYFLVGVSSFQIGVHALQQLSEASKAKRPDNARMCSLGRRTQEMWLITQTHMPQGGQLDAKTAGTILSAVNQYSSDVENAVRQSCNARPAATKNGAANKTPPASGR